MLPPIIIRAAILTATHQNPKIISEKSTSCCRTSHAVFLLLLLPCSNLFLYIQIRRHIKPKSASARAFYDRFLTRERVIIASSVCFRLLFRDGCLWPTEGSEWGESKKKKKKRRGLSITDLNGQPPDSFGLPFSIHTHTHTHTQSHRLSQGFWKDPRVNINFLMHFGSRGGRPQEEATRDHSANSHNRIEWLCSIYCKCLCVCVCVCVCARVCVCADDSTSLRNSNYSLFFMIFLLQLFSDLPFS